MGERRAARQAALAADRLAVGQTIDGFSLCLTLLALAAVFASAPSSTVRSALLLGVGLGVVEKLYAMRVAFDRRVFAGWAASWPATEDFAPDAALAEFDQVLVRLRLRGSARPGGRRLAVRIAGARALLRRQVTCLVLQLLAVSGAALFLPVRPGWPFPHGL